MNLFAKKTDSNKEKKGFFSKIFKNKKIIIGAFIILIIIALIIIPKLMKKDNSEPTTTVAKAEIGTITQVIEGSGTIEAIDKYEVTSLVTGDIIADYFNEGDVLKKGDLMYQIDASDLSSNIERSNLSVERSKLSYDDSVKSLNDLNIKSDTGGTITNIYIKKGDQVQPGGKIADIIDNSVMKLTIDFISDFASNIYIGEQAHIELIGSFSDLTGTVTNIASGSVTNPYGVSVTPVEISVTNPGGILSGDTATAVVGSYACNSPGTFGYCDEKSIYSKASGTVSRVNVSNGDSINAGATVAVLESTAAEDAAKQNSIALKEAQLALDNYTDKLKDYRITAPISGKVIQKNSKAGEKLDATNASTPMAIISDLSTLVFTMSVDELDISSVELGQRVEITADALDGQKFTGTVDNISIVGTSQNGVTSYPVKIVVDNGADTGLIPGMNVDATIIIASRDNVLKIPSVAVNRGNKVTLAKPKDGNTEAAVQLGLNDGEFVEVISGLKEGDEIIVPIIDTSSADLFSTMMEMRENGSGGAPGGGMPGGANNGNRPNPSAGGNR